MTDPYDFSGLTFRQAELLSAGGWRAGCGRQQPLPRTVAKLLERGLLVAHKRNDRRFGPFSVVVPEYDVPEQVQAAWCKQCTGERRKFAEVA